MGRIEDYWEDIEVYYVKFITNENNIITKMIALDIDCSLKEIEEIIFSKFNRIKKIVYIESIGDGLSLKVWKCIKVYRNNIYLK